MYVFTVYICLERILIQPLKRHVHLTVSRRDTCFWDGRPCVSSVRKIAKRTLKGFKEVSEVLNTQPVAWQTHGRFSRRSSAAFFASFAAAPLSRIHRSRHGLHGVVTAFRLFVFASVFVPVSYLFAFFTISRHFDIMVTRPLYSDATALGKINLRILT